MKKRNIPELFGSLVFGDDVMRAKLPKDIYRSLRRTIDDGSELDPAVADAVASAMKDWAIEHGATHYTHWFQPLNGITAEKHDSFLSPQGDGTVIMEFSGKELIRGEPDASSFPSGGLRTTFEARGYTAWDPTSYAFIKDDSLCIPTTFCSYGSEVLDKKTPLLRSMEAVNTQMLRILRLFGDTSTTRVIANVGAEQEYFLIDKKLYDSRRDLLYTGRTLFGAKPPKGQELEDHYFGAIKPRVMAFMREVNEELWKLGVYAKTEHNETAPAQHELAPVYTTANIATDHNQLIMEMMKKVAGRHELACLLHEKPFDGVNGSGKHNNWSLNTNTGQNLCKPGKRPQDNKLFLLLLCAVIKGVDEHQDLLRISASNAGNDRRLGGSEAPPAIVSVFLGDELTSILEAIEQGIEYTGRDAIDMRTGVHILPNFKKDTSDRNRTSPFAFTGNKFEFRMLGSSASIADTNTTINTVIADQLCSFADELEGTDDFEAALESLMRRTVINHKRIIFNGNNYSNEWVKEAKSRGLLNLPTTVDALPYFISEKNIALFGRHNIFTASEIRSRYEILLENYAKVINIEAMTMIEMVKREIFPAAAAYNDSLINGLALREGAGIAKHSRGRISIIENLSELEDELVEKCDNLVNLISSTHPCQESLAKANYYKDNVLCAMDMLRAVVDRLETIVAADYWPYPTYGDMFSSV